MRILSSIRSSVLAALLIGCVSCTSEGISDVVKEDAPLLVGLRLDSDTTKSVVDEDGISAGWTEGDELALWAIDGRGNDVLNAQRFSIYGAAPQKGVFTATLPQAMPEGSYTYYAVYPFPETTDGTVALFDLPQMQSGRASDGADIMVSSPCRHGALEPLKSIDDHSAMSMNMEHLVHLLRFYLPYGTDVFGKESIQKIEIDFPREVVGIVRADVKDPASASLEEGRRSVVLELEKPLEVSGRNSRNYAFATIFPTKFSAGESMRVKLYSQSKVAVLDPISLDARNFAAGHATSVRLVPKQLSSLFRISFRIAANNLGENVQSVTLTAPEGCNWGNGSNVIVITPDKELRQGDTFAIEMEDEVAYRGLSEASVTVTYDSEHVMSTELIQMPSMISGTSSDISLHVPWLLFEDFSSVGGFSSNDEYSMSSAGSKSAVSFLDGWTAARAGASEGQSIRLACRRETSADYPSRADSKPLPTIKKPVNVDVTFDYGADNKYGGITIITDGNVGQNVHIGYVTSTKAYASGDGDGVFQDDNSFYIKEYTGSYTNLPHTTTMTIEGLPAGNTDRITWRTTIEHQAGTHNTTAWLYIDNIKVKLSAKQ